MSVTVTRLASGLTVVTDSMPHLETVSLGVYAGVGTRSETREEHGLAHLLEHMAFKGTRRRDARRIAEEIETVGGDLNAATSIEQTAYYARILREDVGLGLDILADILTDSVFDPDELTREKNVIIQEIGAVEDAPDDLVYDLFTETAYPDQAVGRRVLGTPETVSALDRDAIAQYLAAHYRASRMVVSAAGAVDHQHLVEEATRRFEALPRGAVAPPPPAVYCGGETRIETDHEQANILFGFEGLSYRDADFQALGVLSNIVGGGMSSRLFQEVREKRGLCYSIHSFQWGLDDTGVFGISASASPEDLETLMPVAIDELMGAIDKPTAIEVTRAKAQLKAGLMMALESSSNRAEQMARHILIYSRPLSMAEIAAKIEAVTVEDVRRVGHRLIASPPTLAAIGPIARLPHVDALSGRLAAA